MAVLLGEALLASRPLAAHSEARCRVRAPVGQLIGPSMF